MKTEWKQCCKKEICRIWEEDRQRGGGSMNIVHLQTECPVCKHFIGLTQTSEKEAKEFCSNLTPQTHLTWG